MTVQLTKPELEKYIQDQVEAGHFASREAVIEAALVRMILQDRPSALDDETLAAIEESEDQIARGEFLDWKQASAELRRKYLGQ